MLTKVWSIFDAKRRSLSLKEAKQGLCRCPKGSTEKRGICWRIGRDTEKVADNYGLGSEISYTRTSKRKAF